MGRSKQRKVEVVCDGSSSGLEERLKGYVTTALERERSLPAPGKLAAPGPDGNHAFISFQPGRIEIGVQAPRRVDALIRDLDHLALSQLPDQGAGRQVFALQALSFLSGESIAWQQAADVFWDEFQHRRHVPRAVSVHSDEGEKHALGSGDHDYVLEGPGERLQAVFLGQTVLLDELSRGRLRSFGSFQHSCVLAGLGMEIALGATLWI